MSRNNWTAEKLFFRILNNKSERARWDNIHALRRKPSKEVFDRSIELSYSQQPKERQIGIQILAQLGSEPRLFYAESIKRFFEILEQEEDPEVIMSLLFSIGHNNRKLNKSQIEILCAFGNSDNVLIKEGAVSSLLFINDSRAIDTLIKLSSDKASHIRDWATFGIGQSERDNKKIRTALWMKATDKHADTRAEAIAGLARRKDERARELIAKELLSGNYGTLVLEAIVEYGDKTFLPILRAHLKEDSKSDDISATWLAKLKNCIKELKSK